MPQTQMKPNPIKTNSSMSNYNKEKLYEDLFHKVVNSKNANAQPHRMGLDDNQMTSTY